MVGLMSGNAGLWLDAISKVLSLGGGRVGLGMVWHGMVWYYVVWYARGEVMAVVFRGVFPWRKFWLGSI